MMPDNGQESFFGLSGILFGIVRHNFFWIVRHHFLDCQAFFFLILNFFLEINTLLHEKEKNSTNIVLVFYA